MKIELLRAEVGEPVRDGGVDPGAIAGAGAVDGGGQPGPGALLLARPYAPCSHAKALALSLRS